jgi:hypothetical protein
VVKISHHGPKHGINLEIVINSARPRAGSPDRD